MQRSSVLLPEPERPMMAMISPCSTSSETSFSTSSVPKLLLMSWISTSDIEPPLRAAAPLGKRKAQREVDARRR